MILALMLAQALAQPATWRDRAHAGTGLVVTAEESAGLTVRDLRGRLRSQFSAAGVVGQVDLRTVKVGDHNVVLVGASDRNDPRRGRLALFELDTGHATLRPLGKFDAGIGEARGFCLYQSKRELYAFVIAVDGAIAQLWIQPTPVGVAAQPVRLLKLTTKATGCTVNDRTGQLEVVGQDAVWRFDAAPGASGIAVRSGAVPCEARPSVP